MQTMIDAQAALQMAKDQGVAGKVLRRFSQSSQELREYNVTMPDGSVQSHKIKARVSDHA